MQKKLFIFILTLLPIILFSKVLNNNFINSLQETSNVLNYLGNNVITRNQNNENADPDWGPELIINYLLEEYSKNPDALTEKQIELIKEELYNIQKSSIYLNRNPQNSESQYNIIQSIDTISNILLYKKNKEVLWRSIRYGKVIAHSGANVRIGPGINYKKIGAIAYGTRVKIYGKSGNWYRISYDEKDGYVYYTLIAVASSQGTTTSYIGQGVVIANSGANLRKGPGTKYKIITAVRRGTPVKIIKSVGNWYYLKIPEGTKGYIYKALINIDSFSESNSNNNSNNNNSSSSSNNNISNINLKIAEKALGAVGMSSYVYGHHVYTSFTHYGKLACVAVVTSILIEADVMDKLYYGCYIFDDYLKQNSNQWKPIISKNYNQGDIVFWGNSKKSLRHIGIIVEKDVFGKWWTVDNSSTYLKVMKRPLKRGGTYYVSKAYRYK